ncbi:MAG: hypothetical protein ACR2L6_06195 [Gemmatimonadaceae bacterium]
MLAPIDGILSAYARLERDREAPVRRRLSRGLVAERAKQRVGEQNYGIRIGGAGLRGDAKPGAFAPLIVAVNHDFD